MKRIGPQQIAAVAAIGTLGWLLLAPHASAAGGAAPAAQAAGPNDVGALLTPMLAAATGIERILEMAWNWFESTAQQFAAGLGLGQAWAQYAHDEVAGAEAALNSLATQARLAAHQPGAGPVTFGPGEALAAQIAAAQSRLDDAQQQLLKALQSARCRSIKQAISVLAGVILGLITSFSTGLDMFKLLQFSTAPSAFGLIVTGLIIGAGTGPVHSIIGLLQQTKEAVDQAANLFSSRSRENASQTWSNLVSANAIAATTPQPDSGVRGLAPAAAPAGVTAEQVRAIERLATR